MKDYRPLLSDVCIVLEEYADHTRYGGNSTYSADELDELVEKVTEMFNEIDYEVEGGERF